MAKTPAIKFWYLEGGDAVALSASGKVVNVIHAGSAMAAADAARAQWGGKKIDKPRSMVGSEWKGYRFVTPRNRAGASRCRTAQGRFTKCSTANRAGARRRQRAESEPAVYDRMGRRIESDDRDPRIDVERIPLDRGGYARVGGRYYGTGAPVFRVWVINSFVEDRLRRQGLLEFRARDMKAAKAKIKAALPDVQFSRKGEKPWPTK